MTNDVITVAGDLTVEEARRVLRARLEAPDFVYYVYVLDASDRLRGVLTLRDLLVADETASVADVMMPSLLTIDPLESAESAAWRVAESHLAALPVADPAGQLLGAVTFDAAMLQLAPPSWRDQAPRVFS